MSPPVDDTSVSESIPEASDGVSLLCTRDGKGNLSCEQSQKVLKMPPFSASNEKMNMVARVGIAINPDFKSSGCPFNHPMNEPTVFGLQEGPYPLSSRRSKDDMDRAFGVDRSHDLTASFPQRASVFKRNIG